MRWRLFLPVVGLLLFAGVTYESLRRPHHTSRRYLWWASIPLDSEPLSKSHSACKDGVDNCQKWRPESIVINLLAFENSCSHRPLHFFLVR
jgi:hypothetical protein